jgi:hypothetical protein
LRHNIGFARFHSRTTIEPYVRWLTEALRKLLVDREFNVLVWTHGLLDKITVSTVMNLRVDLPNASWGLPPR